MAQKPTVVVTGNGRHWSPSWWCTWLALRLVGAKPRRVSVRHSLPTDTSIDALIIGGGDDISPTHYQQEPAQDGDYDPQRDDLEIEWIQWALDNDKPMLGICRGAQLINVVLGGSLNQDIRQLRQRTYNRPGLLPTKQVRLKTTAKLASICGKTRLRVNSLHSQIVNKTGEGMHAVGWDLDGFIQATEHQHKRVVGVQWHPEYLFYLISELRIFRWLVATQ